MNEYLLASIGSLTYVAAILKTYRTPRLADIAGVTLRLFKDALVAQLDRALDYESRGREFESSRARHFLAEASILSDLKHFRHV